MGPGGISTEGVRDAFKLIFEPPIFAILNFRFVKATSFLESTFLVKT